MKTIHIRNMVCPRCIKAVETVLGRLEIPYQTVNLGEVDLEKSIANNRLELLKIALSELGFELILEENQKIVNQVKSFVIRQIHYQNERGKSSNLSTYLSEEIGKDYAAISKIFSQSENTTIEKYVIEQKIERAKELLSYGELNLSEIANQLNYSSSAYLSNQFKKVVGVSPSAYRKSSFKSRKTIDSI